jgi:hypothetical protein
MPTSARLVPITLVCDTCGCHFVRTLHDIGWINSIGCPDCGTSHQLECGANARRVDAKQSAWQRAYQLTHFPAPPTPLVEHCA